MARWQDLYEMLIDESLTPEQIVARLNVRPSRLRELLHSKRLAARLQGVEAVSDKRAAHNVISHLDRAAGRLLGLVEATQPETARKACLDVVRSAREAYQARPAEQREWWEAPRRRRAGAEEFADLAVADPPVAALPSEAPVPVAVGELPQAPPERADAPPSESPELPAPVMPPGVSMTRKAAAAMARRKGRPCGPSFEAVMAEAERKRAWRRQIVEHGGVALARRRQRGR